MFPPPFNFFFFPLPSGARLGAGQACLDYRQSPPSSAHACLSGTSESNRSRTMRLLGQLGCMEPNANQRGQSRPASSPHSPPPPSRCVGFSSFPPPPSLKHAALAISRSASRSFWTLKLLCRQYTNDGPGAPHQPQSTSLPRPSLFFLPRPSRIAGKGHALDTLQPTPPLGSDDPVRHCDSFICLALPVICTEVHTPASHCTSLPTFLARSVCLLFLLPLHGCTPVMPGYSWTSTGQGGRGWLARPGERATSSTTRPHPGIARYADYIVENRGRATTSPDATGSHPAAAVQVFLKVASAS